VLCPSSPLRTGRLRRRDRPWVRLSVTLIFSTFAVISGVAQAKPIDEEPHLKLIRVLPAKVPSFAADEPAGSSTQVVGGNMAEASRTYHRGEGSTAGRSR
jgi:hypothetical protein